MLGLLRSACLWIDEPVTVRRSELWSVVAAAVLLLLLLLAGPRPAAAAGHICGDRQEVLKQLRERHSEVTVWRGLGGDGGVLEIVSSPGGGWSLLVTYPGRPTCLVGAGTGSEIAGPLLGRPA